MAKEVAQRPIDLASSAAAGAPAAATDATHVGAATPLADTISGAVGSSLLAARQDHRHPSGGPAGSQIFSATLEPEVSSLGNTETIVREFMVDFDALVASYPNLSPRIAAALADLAGVGTATIAVRTGATNLGSTAGSTLRVSASTASASLVPVYNVSTDFANPGGRVIVQVTLNGSTAAVLAATRAIQVEFWGAV